MLALAVAVMTLSTDGARLKRLFAGRAGSAPEPARLAVASYELPGMPLAATPIGEPAQLMLAGERPETPASPAASLSDPLGSVFAEILGPAGVVEVLLDSELMGIAPLFIGSVGPGPHRLTFQSETVSWDEEVNVSAGDTTIVACVAPDELVSAVCGDSLKRATPLLP